MSAEPEPGVDSGREGEQRHVRPLPRAPAPWFLSPHLTADTELQLITLAQAAPSCENSQLFLMDC